ncbi:MAG: HNH endonuclease [Thermoplasmata archaeon]
MNSVDSVTLEKINRKYSHYGRIYDFDISGSTEKSDIPWNVAKEIVLERDGYRCRICGRSPVVNDESGGFPKVRIQVEVHHIIPRIAGGSDSTKNLVTLCKSCHIRTFKHEYSGLPEEIALKLDRRVKIATNNLTLQKFGNNCIDFELKSFYYRERSITLQGGIPCKICEFASLKKAYDLMYANDLDLDEVIIKIENKELCVGLIEK